MELGPSLWHLLRRRRRRKKKKVVSRESLLYGNTENGHMSQKILKQPVLERGTKYQVLPTLPLFKVERITFNFPLPRLEESYNPVILSLYRESCNAIIV
jgi:hypothetical protein